MIQLFRVDYRLLHGQVIYVWCNNMEIDAILVASDRVVKDEFRKATMRMVKPDNCKLIFKSIEDSIVALNSGATDKYQLMILVEDIEDAHLLAKQVTSIAAINLGLSQKTTLTHQIEKAVHVSDHQISLLKELIAENVEVYLQQIPTQPKTLITIAQLENINA